MNRSVGAMIAHVLRRLFVDKDDSLINYLCATLDTTELGALRYLDRRHQELYHRPSILAPLLFGRTGLFKRLYSLKFPWGHEDDAHDVEARRLFEQVGALTLGERADYLNHVARDLSQLFRKELGERELSDDDVLLDIPGRSLDQDMGAVFVCSLAPDGTAERSITSPFVHQLQSGFHSLSRTIRLFISPDVRHLVGKDRLESARTSVEDILRGALKQLRPDRKGHIS